MAQWPIDRMILQMGYYTMCDEAQSRLRIARVEPTVRYKNLEYKKAKENAKQKMQIAVTRRNMFPKGTLLT